MVIKMLISGQMKMRIINSIWMVINVEFCTDGDENLELYNGDKELNAWNKINKNMGIKILKFMEMWILII